MLTYSAFNVARLFCNELFSFNNLIDYLLILYLSTGMCT